LSEDVIRLPLAGFKRPNLVNQIINHIAEMHGVEHAESEINGEFHSRLARSGLDSVTLLEQQQAEAIESRIFQRKAIFRLVHAEAARPAGPRGEEDVIVENLLAW